MDTLLDEAAWSELTLREALTFLVERAITRRDARRIGMASKLAQFPFVRELDGFDFEAQPSLDPRQLRDLAVCRWIAHGYTVLFLAPPGTGKTHRVVALGREAIRQNYSYRLREGTQLPRYRVQERPRQSERQFADNGPSVRSIEAVGSMSRSSAPAAHGTGNHHTFERHSHRTGSAEPVLHPGLHFFAE